MTGGGADAARASASEKGASPNAPPTGRRRSSRNPIRIQASPTWGPGVGGLEERVPLQEELGRVLRVVLGNAVVLARAQAELRELERRVLPYRAVPLALVFLHIGVGIVVFVGELEVVALGRFVVAFDERRPLFQPPGRGSVVGDVHARSEPADAAGAQPRENALHAAV